MKFSHSKLWLLLTVAHEGGPGWETRLSMHSAQSHKIAEIKHIRDYYIESAEQREIRHI